MILETPQTDSVETGPNTGNLAVGGSRSKAIGKADDPDSPQDAF